MSQPSEQIAIVTGANRGIGRAIAAGLAERGLTVLLAARDTSSAQPVADGLRAAGRRAEPVPLDVTDQRSVDALRDRVASTYGRLDVLVNNAGAFYDQDQLPATEDLATVEGALAVNLVGPWRLCQAFLPLLRRGGHGRIVNLSSGLGTFGETGPRDASAPAYSVSKAALNMLTAKLAAELRGSGILVNAANPGWVRTDMGGPAAPRTPEQGADTPIWLATLPDDGPTGGIFGDRRPIPW